jgi:MFS transporter, DHA2 family, multidrug resistance protein
MTMVAAIQPQTDQVSKRVWIGIISALVGSFMAVLDIQITNSSLQNIQAALNATLEEGSWISTSYLVAEIIAIPLTGWLGRIFSLRWFMVGNAILFVAFSFACSLSWNLSSMIAFRAFQGFTGGALIPTALTIVLTSLPRSKIPIGLTMFGLVTVFAPGIGPAIGGWLTDNLGWQYIFYLNILPGIFLVSGVWYGVPAQVQDFSLFKQGDWWGILTMAIGLGCLTAVLEEGNRKDWFGSELIVQLSIVSFISLVAFLIIELTIEHPFIELRLLGQRNFALTCLVNVVLGLGTYGAIYLLPVYLAQIQGYNAMQTGQVMIWIGLPQLLLLPFVPLLMSRIDVRVLIGIGVILFAAGCLVNTTMSQYTGRDQLLLSLILLAFAQPLLYIPMSSVATAEIPQEQAGSASGLFNMLRNLGGSLGISVLASLLSQRERFHSNRLGEAVSLFSLETQQRLDQSKQYFVSQGADPVTAYSRALASIDLVIRRESFIIAYSDCFLFIGFVFIASIGAVLLLKKVKLDPNASGGH